MLHLQKWVNFIHRQSERVPPLPLLNGRLGVRDSPLIDGVRETLLDSLLPKPQWDLGISAGGKKSKKVVKHSWHLKHFYTLNRLRISDCTSFWRRPGRTERRTRTGEWSRLVSWEANEREKEGKRRSRKRNRIKGTQDTSGYQRMEGKNKKIKNKNHHHDTVLF